MKLIARYRGIALVFLLCGAALVLVSKGQLWPVATDFKHNPAGPLLAVVRVVLGCLAVWVASLTMVTTIAQRSGRHDHAERFSRLLPATVQRLIRTGIGVGLSGTIILNGSALAKPDLRSNQSNSATEQASIATTQLGSHHQPETLVGEKAKGWPTFTNGVTAAGNGAPTLVVRGFAAKSAEESTIGTSSPVGVSTTPPGTRPTGVRRTQLKGTISIPRGPITHGFNPRGPITRGPITEGLMPQRTKGEPTESPPTDSPTIQVESQVYTVRAGDHFWSIAESVVNQHDNVENEFELVAYWQKLVELNRLSLVDPSNPDLLIIGSSIELPPLR